MHPLGINTYSLRALRWTDAQLLDYAAGQKLDAIFLQDSLDPRTDDPAHWTEVRDLAARHGLLLQTGGGGIFPKAPGGIEASRQHILRNLERAKAMGSKVSRFAFAGQRSALPPGPIPGHIATAIKLLRSVREQALSAGVTIVLEPHKDFQAREFREIVEGSGKDFVGIHLDTANPLQVLEDPMQTLEILGPYARNVQLNDSVVYEHPNGVAVQSVPLGEGTIDFRAYFAKLNTIQPDLPVFIKPITGRPPTILPLQDPKLWDLYPDSLASDYVRFLKLARSGRPYENPVVQQDVPGRPLPPHLLPAIQMQQKEHVELGVKYARAALGCGLKNTP